MSERSERTGRFSRDVAWNVGSLAVAGGCGILLNYLIGVRFGAAALGIFNQVFAFYILFSQLAALGFHYSVLKYVAASDDPVERTAIVSSALLATGAVGAVASLVFLASAAPVAAILDSREIATGIAYAAPGILFFALSKVSLAALNGLRRMRAYAIFFAGRLVLMIAGFAVCVAVDADREALPVILAAAEAATFLLTLPAIRGELGRVARADLGRWIREHRRFGVRGFMSGILSELNTRVDVLILGGFAGDAVVGAYSFAAILAEGLYQLLVVLRTNFAPILIRLWAEQRHDELTAIVRRARDRTYLGAIAVGAVAVTGYVVVVPWTTSDPALVASWRYFAVLIAGMVASAGYLPFQPVLLYAGRPGAYTALMLAIVAINAMLNLALIAALGPIGSAIATALAFVAGVALLRVLAARLLGLRL